MPFEEIINRADTKYRIQNTEYRIQNTEYRIQSTENSSAGMIWGSKNTEITVGKRDSFDISKKLVDTGSY